MKISTKGAGVGIGCFCDNFVMATLCKCDHTYEEDGKEAERQALAHKVYNGVVG